MDRMSAHLIVFAAEVFILALLRIVREPVSMDRLRSYKVIIDGEIAGVIKNGESKEFPISSGQHELSLKIDWCGSNTIRFVAAEGDVLTFDARSNLTGLKMLAAFWYVCFKRSSYLLIEQRCKEEAHPANANGL